MRITIQDEFDWKAAVDFHWPLATVEAMFNAGRGLNARIYGRQIGAWSSQASEGGWLILPELDCAGYDEPAPFQWTRVSPYDTRSISELSDVLMV